MGKRIFVLNFVIFILILILFSSSALAIKQIKLLSIEETESGEKGDVADLYVRTIRGSGNIYTATFPLTKVDTQISARFARDIACDFLDKDCDDLDFLYNIRANTASVSGPSGGAAIAIATIAEIENLDINPKVGITGTINTGGLIGPVGGLIKKLKGARNANLTKVLIPHGTRFVVNDSKLKEKIKNIIKNNITINESDFENLTSNNDTVDLIELGKSLGLEVIEVTYLDEALFHFTGKQFKKFDLNISIDPSYKETMKIVSEELCERNQDLKSQVLDNEDSELYKEGSELFSKATNASLVGNYYTAASYCFGSNVDFRNLIYLKLDKVGFLEEAQKISNFKIKTANYSTLRNLQTYLIVKQRLDEKDILIREAIKELNKNNSNFSVAVSDLAFARERLQSAVAWSKFFNLAAEDKTFTMEELENSCVTKLHEAQQRYDYANIYFPNVLKNTQKLLGLARKDNSLENYESCLFKAAIAKAEADAILSTLGYKKSQLMDLVRNKLIVAEQQIAKQEDFPILAYSYYEYANSLLEDNTLAALSYAEFAIELADLGIYFKETKPYLNGKFDAKRILNNAYFYWILGILIGLILGKLIYQRPRIFKKAKKSSKK